jgi:hypothetical protein
MDFETEYPEYVSVAEYVRRANLERSVHLAHLFAAGIARIVTGMRRIASSPESAAADREAVRADPFLHRAVARY